MIDPAAAPLALRPCARAADRAPPIKLMASALCDFAPMHQRGSARHAMRRPGRGRPGTRHSRRERSFVAQLVIGCLFVGFVAWQAEPHFQSMWAVSTNTPQKLATSERSVYFRNCDAARAAGAAPIYRGSPGYRHALDRDGDGIACEPYRGR